MDQLNKHIIKGLVKSELGENALVVGGELLDPQDNSNPSATIFIVLARVVFLGIMGHESPVNITLTGDFDGSPKQLATIREDRD